HVSVHASYPERFVVHLLTPTACFGLSVLTSLVLIRSPKVSFSQVCAAAQCRFCLRLTNGLVNVSTNVLVVVSLLLIFAATTFGATLVVPAGGDLQSA